MRSSVVILAIAFGLLGGLFSSAWMNGMADQRVQDTFDFETGHIQIHHPDFPENEDVKYTIGSQWKQRYLVQKDGTYYIAPTQFNIDTGRWVNNRAENSHLPFRRRERAIRRFVMMGSRVRVT